MQDERSAKLYGEEPIVVDSSRYQELIGYYNSRFSESEAWFQKNYEQDFIQYSANYQSIPGDVVKPWNDANDYFMPSTNITVENYVARFLQTVRGGRDFLTVYPRGREDAERAKMVQLYLRYMFETPMRGHPKLVDHFRNKSIFGTSIATMPWNLEFSKERIPGKYLFDTEADDWVREIPEENDSGENPPPKDFSGVDLRPILGKGSSFKVRELFRDVKIADHPDLEVLDLFNVKIDPSGGPDIQKHAYTIIETVETIDQIKRKAKQGIYSQSEVDKLVASVNAAKSDENPSSVNLADDNQGIRTRNAIEGKSIDDGVINGVKLWICYGRHEIDQDFEEETITIIANKRFLLRFRPSSYKINGKSYRPLLVDRFITLPHRFYGIGIGQILEDLNYLLNHLVNQILNHGDIYNSPPLIVPSDSNWEPSEHIYGPGQTWLSENAEGFRILPTPDIKGSQIQMITFVEGFIQKSLGINDFTLGGSSSNIVNNDTAHGLASIMRETNRRVDFYAQNSHETFIRDMYEMILWQSQQFMDETMIPKITDIDNGFSFTEVSNEDIQGMYDFRIFADSLTASKEFDQAKWQNLLQIFSQLVDPATQTPLYDIKKLGSKVLEAFGEPFPENFETAPEQQMQQQGMGAPVAEGGPPQASVSTEQPAAEGRLGPIEA